MRNISGPLPAVAVLVAYFGLTLMDAVIKDLTDRFHVGQIVAFRYWFGAVAAAPFFLRSNPGQVTVGIVRDSAVRAILISIAAACFFFALSIIPLAEATAVAFTSPLFVVVFAALILREQVTPVAALSIGLGLAGVAVMVWDDLVTFEVGSVAILGAGLVLVAALGYAMVMVLTRLHSARADPAVLVFCQTVSAAVVTLPVLVMTWRPVTLDDVGLFALVGTLGSVSYFALAWAFSRANAARLSPLEYSVLPWAILFGYMFFGEVPRLETLLGAVLIVSACVLILMHQRGSRELPDRGGSNRRDQQ